MTPALQLQNISVSFRGQPVLERVNLNLESGGFLGLIGPNGAGKSVLLKTIVGLVRPQEGSVRIFGKSVAEARGLVGYVPQFGAFDPSFPITVLEVALMGRLARRRGFGPYSRHDKKIALQSLERVSMAELARHQVGKLSGGQLQRVLIARALAAEPKLLLLDEPTASLDTHIGLNLYTLLESLSGEMTIVLASHDIGVMSRYVKTIACLNRKLHYHDSKELSHEVLEEVYGCPVDLIAHGHSHRVLGEHEG